MKSIHYFIYTAFLLYINLYPLPAQTKNSCTEPSVVFYDCNTSSAVTTNSSQESALHSASKQILLAILSDSTSRQVHLFSYGFADTTDNEAAFPGAMFTLPDTGGVRDADYVISGRITGRPGSYNLTVSLLDGYTFARVTDGTALFSSATIEDVSTASSNAVRQLLPLISSIRKYQAWQKSANPLLAINPTINIIPAKNNLPLKGSTEVTITVVDCDGAPLAGRQLKLESNGGSFTSTTVKTDPTGNAKAVFNAGSTDGVAMLTATIPNLISVTHDTIYNNGSASVIIGNVDVSNLWVLRFNLGRSWTSYLDKMTPETDGTKWEQENTYWSQYAFGTILAKANKTRTEFDFIDTTMSVSGVYFKHDFGKMTGPSPWGQNCPDKIWQMTGNSQTFKAKVDSENKPMVNFEYDPTGFNNFTLHVPFINLSVYGYRWYRTGEWVNNYCRTYMVHDNSRTKIKLNTTAGIAMAGKLPVKGLAIFPTRTNGVITGYTINVNITRTGYTTRGEYWVSMDKCTATLKPYSPLTKDK